MVLKFLNLLQKDEKKLKKVPFFNIEIGSIVFKISSIKNKDYQDVGCIFSEMDLGTTKKISVYSSFLKMTNKKITKFHENLKLIIQIQFTQN